MSKIDLSTLGGIYTRITDKTEVCVFLNADRLSFFRYCQSLEEISARLCEHNERETHLYAAYSYDGDGIFVNYYPAIKELTIVYERSCPYFDRDRGFIADPVCSPQITQLHLEDFGMSYVIRLSDGRFVVIDGGRELEPDADNLYKTLAEQSPEATPTVACWIMSHPHSDHFYCFIKFMEKYGELVRIQSFMLNFPRFDDLEHYPKLAARDTRIFEVGKRFDDTSSYANIPIFEALMEKTGAEILVAHTGQTYRIGDASFEVLSSIEDTIHLSQNINAASLVLRMTLGDQVTLWTTDAACSVARLSERYGDYLRADILQVPHHGFGSGTPEAEIECYELIKPRICLLPVSDFNAYTAFCAHKPSARYLMTQCDVEEMITGDVQRTLTLPYTPRKNGRDELKRKYLQGQNASGSTVWVFTQLSTAKQSNLEFTFLNATHAPTTVWAELFFEDKANALRWIGIELPAMTSKTVSIVGEEVKPDEVYFNPWSLSLRGLPENAEFSVRFTSEVAIFVSHSERSPLYHSTTTY